MSSENEQKTPTEWCRLEGVEILDADGWRGPDRRDFADPITLAEFRARLATCTQRSLWAAAQPAGEPCGCPIFTTHTTHGNPWCQCGHQYSSHTSPGAACTMTASPTNEHRPIGVRSTDVGAFIRCSCGNNPTPHYWLKAHWPGDKSEGERLLRELASAIGGGE